MASISQFEYAIALDTHRHFGRAARSCNVTQPTLSAQLSKLEDELGVLLFDRSVSPILPTADGQEILKQARIMISEFSKIRAIADGAMEDVAGEFIIGIIPTVAPYLLPLFLQNFSRNFPKLKIDIREMTTSEIIGSFDRDLIDVGVLAVPVEGVNFFVETLYVEPFYVFHNRQDSRFSAKKITPDMIDGRDLWLLEEGHCLRGQILAACKLEARRGGLTNVKFQSGSLETIKRLVAKGIGYTLVPHLALDIDRDGDDEIKVLPFVAPVPAREIGLMYRRQQLKKPAIEALKVAIKNSLPRSLILAGKDAIALKAT